MFNLDKDRKIAELSQELEKVQRDLDSTMKSFHDFRKKTEGLWSDAELTEFCKKMNITKETLMLHANVLPCPFCGGEHKVVEERGFWFYSDPYNGGAQRPYTQYHTVCQDCGAKGPASMIKSQPNVNNGEPGKINMCFTVWDALEAWNTRK